MVSSSEIAGQAVDFDPFSQGTVQYRVGLTEAQKEIWTSVQFGPEANCAFNESLWVEFKGNLDSAAIRTALRDVVARHEALRSTFSPDGKYLCITSSFVPDIEFEDFSTLSAAERQQSVLDLQRRAAETPFDLVLGPLLRLQLVRLDREQHGLLMTAHHIICDGWSFWVFLEDLAGLYNARKKNIAPVLPEPVQFRQYAEALHDPQYQEKSKRDLEYWKKQYTPLPDPLALPTYQPRPLQRSFVSRRIDYVFSQTLVNRLQQQASTLQVTLTSILLSALSCYLHRICRQKDIVIGVPSAGQSISGFFHLIGHCINLLPLRYQADGNKLFVEYARQCREILLDGYEHQHITYGTLVQQLKVGRDPGRPPLVSVVFNIDQGMDDVTFDELEITVFTPPRLFENFDLFFNVVQDKQGVTLECQYQTALFNADTLSVYLDGFRELLEAVSKDPEQQIGDLPLVSPDEYHLQIEEFNQTRMTLPPVPGFINLFRKMAQQHAKKKAAVYAEKSLTYQELDQQSDQLAAYLRGQEVKQGALVGIYLSRSLDMLVAILGVLKAGAGYVPLDPEFPHERLQYMIDDAGLGTLISEEGLDAGSFSFSGRIIDIKKERQRIANCDTAGIRDIVPGKKSIAYVIYTSGSTGKPKGVAVPHGAVLNFLVSMQQQPGMGPDDILLAVTTLSFDIAVLELYLPLITGATVVLAGAGDLADAGRLLRLLNQSGITILQATPSTWKQLFAAGWKGSPQLKALCGGEPLSRNLADSLVDHVDELWNMYGPTETTVWSTVSRIREKGNKVLIGKPIGNTSLYILDENRKPVPRGVAGELYIGGEGVTLGYLHRPELTARAFVRNPFSDDANDIVYRTGDLVRYRFDGEVEFISRLDNQIKLRGYRIELGEIETVLNGFAGVGEVVVNVFSLSEEDQRLVAYIIQDGELDIDQLRTGLREKLPSYMVPQHFLALESFPLTANGKIDRKALPPPTSRKEAERDVVRPRNDFERSLLAVWKHVLEVDELGISDNFFDHGGHSLLALTLVNEMKRATGITIEYGSIFLYPTIQDLADNLGRETSKQASSVVPLQRKGSGMPLFCLCGINLYREFARSLGETQPVYAIYADEEQALLEKAVQGELGTVSVKKLADSYCRAILRQQPAGPYQLAGISFGGILAIETARLLQEQGQEVALVIMLDTILKKGEQKSPVGVLQYHWRHAREQGFDYLLSRAKKRLGEATPETTADNRGKGNNEEAGVRFRELVYLQTLEEYEENMKPYHGDAVLVRAEATFSNDGPVSYLPGYGWEEYIHGSFTVIDIPGDHLGIITSPHVEILAEQLKPLLKE